MHRQPAFAAGRALLLAGTVLAGASAWSLPALAQSAAAVRAAAGLPAGGGAAGATSGSAAAAAPGATIDPLRLIRDQSSAQARALATQQRVLQKSSLAVQAQAAARQAAMAAPSSIPNGIATNGLMPGVQPNQLIPAAQDPTGKRTWEGALYPTQATAGGLTTVTVEQTQERAMLSWETLNVGRETKLQFLQRQNGVVQPDWIAVNRVVGRFDPNTGGFTDPQVSEIAGQIVSDATVVLLNRAGVMFTGTSQINTRSLFVSTLEIGRNGGNNPLSVANRNDEFLRLGLLGPADQAGSAAIAFQTFSRLSDDPTTPGDIVIKGGAEITAGDSGSLFFLGTNITNSGVLSATEGVVSLQSTLGVRLVRATGTGEGPLSLVRGLVPESVDQNLVGSVTNTAEGIISAPRGYVSLGAGQFGTVTNSGLLQATTSVSRNGFVELVAGTVRLADVVDEDNNTVGTIGGVIAITPDENGETIPQSPSSLDAFKTSQIRITGTTIPAAQGGSTNVSEVTLDPTALIYAPSADVVIGTGLSDVLDTARAPTGVTIASGATIDVGGIKDLALPSSRNSLQIGPLKRNELRDTPLYRETGSFLNGATVFVDPRRSGVRDDGTRWVGSPLVEAESFYQQVGVTAAELMTTGGNVTIGTAYFSEFTGSSVRRDPAVAPAIVIGKGASIDISGGWVRYQAGEVQTSQLITANGEIVDIGDADPNALYVGLVNPFSQTVTRFGITESFDNATLQGVKSSPSYTEGRDAGSLTFASSVLALDGQVYADAFAGDNQRGAGDVGTETSTVPGDRRNLQATPFELPASGFLFVRALSESNTLVGGGNARITASVAPLDGITLTEDRRETFLFGADALTAMGLGQFSIWTSGGLTVDPGTTTRLMPGGIFEANTGRAIDVAGRISTPGGTISLNTYTIGNRFYTGAETTGGSVFAIDPAGLGSFDVTITGVLSARGRFVNDFGLSPSVAEGPGYTDGGNIEMSVAPSVISSEGTTLDLPVDISGSIYIEPAALLDVAGGLYVEPDGGFDFSARGGDVDLVNQTIFFQLRQNYTAPIAQLGVRGFRITLPSSVFPDFRVQPANPDSVRSTVQIADGSIVGHGFGGGGTFNLTTPAFNFGAPDGLETRLPLNFGRDAGFSTVSIAAFRTEIFENRFVNPFGGTNALLKVNTVRVGSGETLDLTQTQFPNILTTDQALLLRGAATGSNIYGLVTPTVPDAPFDRRPIELEFGGVSELSIAAGGSVVGAAGATISTPRLLNEGTIRLPGGTIEQAESLPGIYDDANPRTGAIGVRDLSEVFTIQPNGDIIETDLNSAGIVGLTQQVLTNAQLAFERTIYLLGDTGQFEGISLAPGSVTDLSGTSLINPRATTAGGVPIYDGRLVDGGAIETAPRQQLTERLFETPMFSGSALDDQVNTAGVQPGRLVNATPNSRLDISGASDSYVRRTANGSYVPMLQWSDAGSLIMANGGSLGGADIRALGGAPQAYGGTLLTLAPTLLQSGVSTDPTILYADQLEAAGFDSLIVRGALAFEGSVELQLDRLFQLVSRVDEGGAVDPQAFAVTIGGTGDLLIEAPVIRFDSITQRLSSLGGGAPGTSSATFRATSLDVEGAVLFDASIAETRLEASNSIRFIGTPQIEQTLGTGGAPIIPSLIGQLQAVGNLTLAAGQVYPTTGSTFSVAAAGADSVIRIEPLGGPAPSTPYAAGANLTIQAATIEQAGVLRAPLSTLTLGANAPLVINGVTAAPATNTLTLLPGSITSVSANGLRIPYGITTDQVEYFFTPTTTEALTAPPAGTLILAGETLDLQQGATVDISGGGEVYAYEFIPGVGGSRDVLSRFNNDQFSGNDGFLFPDDRQVYAIVPGLSTGEIALYDPIYSADYAALYGSQAGRQVYLDAANGIAAGWYTLLPARYALLPGGLRVVEQPEYGQGVIGTGQRLLDGTQLVSGYYGYAGGGRRESELRVFSVQTQDVFRQYSNIVTTDATPTFSARAERDGLSPPRSPIDAGRLVLQPILSLAAAANFLTEPDEGGRSSSADIAGQAFLIFGSEAPMAPPADTILIGSETLNNLNVASLFIGGTRTDNLDGTTTLDITARTIDVLNSADTALIAPEILLAVDGSGSAIRIADGATIIAQGALTDPRAGAYVIDGSGASRTGAGALFRATTGPQRTVERRNVDPVAVAPALVIDLATIRASSLLIDSTGTLAIASPATGQADIAADDIALGARGFAFTNDAYPDGLAIDDALFPVLRGADRLTLTSATPILFSAGAYDFGDITLDAPGLGLSGAPGAVAVNAVDARLQSSGSVAGIPCSGPDCGTSTFALTVDTLTFGSGNIPLTGFGGGVSIIASSGINYDGVGGLDAGSATLEVTTPFIADRAVPLVPGEAATLPALALTSESVITVARGNLAARAPGEGTPGSRLILTGSSISVDSARLRATAGLVELNAAGDLNLTGTAIAEAPGYARDFGDSADPKLVSAPGGTVRLTSAGGTISVGSDATLGVGGDRGRAGSIEILAASGDTLIEGTLDAAAPEGAGSFRLATGGAFNLGTFDAAPFTGSIRIATGSGDLELAAGRLIRAQNVHLDARGGALTIGGTIDTSGVEGGDIGLFGSTGVTLTGSLLATAQGYAANDSRRARGGDVTLGTGEGGQIELAAGSIIDLSAKRPGNRLVTDVRNDVTYYRVAQSDEGGTLVLRAPIVEQPGPDSVDVTALGSVVGARAISVEAYKRFDLAQVEAAGLTGVTVSNGAATLNTSDPGTNFLASYAPGTIPEFVQDFDLSGATGIDSLRASGRLVERPGIELVFDGDVVLDGNWNFGAAEVDVAGAVAAGLMFARSDRPDVFFVDYGSEAELLANYAQFTYRVGGRADGAAGALSIRAGGGLTLNGSITDGFFAFRDQTAPEALNFTLGGGISFGLSNTPVLAVPICEGSCGTGPVFMPDLDPAAAVQFVFRDQPFAPYNPDANLPSALGAGPDASGDPLGTADIFPRLPSGEAPQSWSYRLTAGALDASADPLAVDGASAAALNATSQTQYAAEAQDQFTLSQDAVLVRASPDGAPVTTVYNLLAAFLAENPGATPDTAVTIPLVAESSSLTQLLQELGLDFFSGYPDQAILSESGFQTIAVTTTIALAADFLQQVDPFFSEVVSSGFFGQGSTGFVRGRIRTGTGNIALAAAGNINTVGTPSSPDRRFQAGSTAIYTAGTVADLSSVTATTSGGDSRTVDLLAVAQTGQQTTPSAPLANALVQTPAYLVGGGDVSVRAGGDVLGRRDVVGGLRLTATDTPAAVFEYIGRGDTPYRVGFVGAETDIRTNPQLFQTGIGTLGGGDIEVSADGTLRDLTVVANTSALTPNVTGGGLPDTRGLMQFGGGNVRLDAGNDITSGLFDVGAGSLIASAGGAVNSTGTVTVPGAPLPIAQSNAVRIRVTDAVASLEAVETIDLRGIAGFGAASTTSFDANNNARGFYTPTAAVSLLANGTVTVENVGSDALSLQQQIAGLQIAVFPGRFEAASLGGDINLAPVSPELDYQIFMAPSPVGELNLFAAANITQIAINMEDGDPGILPGYLTIFRQELGNTETPQAGRNYYWPAVFSDTTDAQRRTFHNAVPTHANNPNPVRIAAGGDITNLTVNLPKQARISAGRDIVNAYFVGQNLGGNDVTRIVAGRDITATTRVVPTPGPNGAQQLPVIEGNNFVIGGPGAFFLEAGRDAGPFLNSAVVGSRTYGSGVLSVGNEYNPWLGEAGADVSVLFGVAPGVNFTGFRNYYVDPANVENLPDDLFVNTRDEFNVFVPDRTMPIYEPILIAWMQENQASALQAAFGTTDVSYEQAYQVFSALPELSQRIFLLNEVYFNELVQTSLPDTVSFGKPSRGYRAVETLFPSDWGYTANNFSPDPDTPVDGELGSENPIETGNLDLRLATVQTARGGAINILGPGGRVLGGSTVATAQQAERRGFIGDRLAQGLRAERDVTPGNPLFSAVPIDAIPTGFEGFITLRGGEVNGFVDRDFLLNQSRLFTQGGGDITLFSSNGDLNAGQGARTSANFPPVAVRIGPNANSEVDAVGGVSGAGIAAFAPGPGIEPPSVFLIAPTGTVDAGDAGVRVAGNLFVAAVSVANADNFSVGGTAFGVPSGPVVNVSGNTAAAAASAAATAAAQQAASQNASRPRDTLSRIVVTVLGYFGGDDPCDRDPRPANCPAR